MKFRKILSFVGVLGAFGLALSACSQKKQADNSNISIVTTTNIYSDIAKNIVGKYGNAKSIITKGSVDPHAFEPTTADAKTVAKAKIVVANGIGYDPWMNKLASSANKKPLLVGEDLMGLKKGANPHIWYNLTMPTKYVNCLVKKLSNIDKKHAAYFKKNGQQYLAKVAKIETLAKSIDGKNKKMVYVSEPVFDYALQAAGYKVGDPKFEEAIENETDPSAKVVGQMRKGISERKISFFVDNIQTSSSTVNNFVKLANKNNIPVLKVRETIPDNTTYLDWMTENYQKLAEVTKQLNK